MDLFFVGLHQLHHLHHFPLAFVSVNRLRRRRAGRLSLRRKPLTVARWIMDSGAFSELSREQDRAADGSPLPNDYRYEVSEYAALISCYAREGQLLAAVAQDYMCEPFILAKTGLTILEHQQKTIARYDELLRYETGCYILPVLQGYAPSDYVRHLHQYGSRLAPGAWVGVGSICKRNSNPESVLAVLGAIHSARSDLRLHGFGLKITALADPRIRSLLYSADSMAWSFHARMHGRDRNGWEEARRFVDRIEGMMAGDLAAVEVGEAVGLAASVG